MKKLILKNIFKWGDEILVEVIKVDKEGNYILSRKNAYYNELMDKLKSYETGEIIEAPVVEIVKRWVIS